MTFAQLFEWREYADKEIFADERLEYLFASVVQALINVNMGRGKAPLEIEELRLHFGDRPQRKKKMTWQEMQKLGMKMTEDSRGSEDV
jgi:hypothetical protein